MKGIKFIMIDGTVDHYDPVEVIEDIDDELIFWVGGYEYRMKKSEVEKHEWYEICEVCGHELTEGQCLRCYNE